MTTKADVLDAIQAVDDAHNTYLDVSRVYLERNGWRHGLVSGWWHQDYGKGFKRAEAISLTMQHDEEPRP